MSHRSSSTDRHWRFPSLAGGIGVLATLLSACLGAAQIVTVQGANGLDLQQNGLLIEVPNSSSTSPALNKLVVLTNSGTAALAATTNTTGVLGICLVNCTSSGNAVIATMGVALCSFDTGGTVAGHYVQASTTNSGNCSDAGTASYPTNGNQVLGRALTNNSGSGSYSMVLYPAESVSQPAFQGGGPISVSGVVAGVVTVGCSTCVVASSPGTGIAHFAGSTQSVTSSAVDLSGADATGILAAARFPALTGAVTTTAGNLATTASTIILTRECEVVWGGTGASATLSSGDDSIVNQSCFNKTGKTWTITAIYCRSDAASNTTTINPTFGSIGTGTTILSSSLTCGSSGAYSATGAVSNSTYADGNNINPVMGGTLTGTSIHVLVVYTIPSS
jgi:hypothetical protein